MRERLARAHALLRHAAAEVARHRRLLAAARLKPRRRRAGPDPRQAVLPLPRDSESTPAKPLGSRWMASAAGALPTCGRRPTALYARTGPPWAKTRSRPADVRRGRAFEDEHGALMTRGKSSALAPLRRPWPRAMPKTNYSFLAHPMLLPGRSARPGLCKKERLSLLHAAASRVLSGRAAYAGGGRAPPR